MGLRSRHWLSLSRTLMCFFLRHSFVALAFLGDYGSSCLEITDKITLCSSGLIPHCSDDHWNSTMWDLAWSPSPRLCFFPFANKSHQLLSPSHQAAWRWSCSPFQPCVGLQSCPWHPWAVLWSWPWWRVWKLIDWLLLWTGVFYTGNKLRLGALPLKG